MMADNATMPGKIARRLPSTGEAKGHGAAEVDPAVCWPAFYSRDARFDGRIFAGVVTTNIYCRSICPVPFAKPNNIVWFATAAAAEAEGFQPCRRCRPQAAPGTPAWQGSSAVVSRALKLIMEGDLDTGDVDQLAERVGIGSRQLRRLFVQHMGASPIKIAITRRVHFARTLIEETALPITEIAMSAGFQSVRQFNHAIHTTYGQPPRRLRELAGEIGTSSKAGGLSIRLSYRPPFDWVSILKFLRNHAIPGVESVDEVSYRRTVEIDGICGDLDVRHDPVQTQLIVGIHLPRYEGLMSVVDRVRRIFDLRADPLQISNHLRRDPHLQPLLDAHPGLRVPGAWDRFESCVCAILGDSIEPSRSTRRLVGRFVETFGKPGAFAVHGLTRLFPRPHEFSIAELSSIGIRGDRADAICALARAVGREKLTFDASRSLEESIARLLAIPGVDRATAEYVALRVFGEPDAFPVKPSVLKGFFSRSFIDRRAEGDLQTTDQWRPWRAYAAMYLTSFARQS
ncbi:MAG: AlkA N-terminal domain-containing protein [Terracidiphilus sp.]|jgi:AraC family transcriptional regulator of adaptative response / DNA-3-methyladenine glycosylase II